MAEQETIVQFLSIILFKFNWSKISSADKLKFKSCLLAYIKTGKLLNSGCCNIKYNSFPLSSNL